MIKPFVSLMESAFSLEEKAFLATSVCDGEISAMSLKYLKKLWYLLSGFLSFRARPASWQPHVPSGSRTSPPARDPQGRYHGDPAPPQIHAAGRGGGPAVVRRYGSRGFRYPRRHKDHRGDLSVPLALSPVLAEGVNPFMEVPVVPSSAYMRTIVQSGFSAIFAV